jgi:hypothetical protein
MCFFFSSIIVVVVVVVGVEGDVVSAFSVSVLLRPSSNMNIDEREGIVVGETNTSHFIKVSRS